HPPSLPGADRAGSGAGSATAVGPEGDADSLNDVSELRGTIRSARRHSNERMGNLTGREIVAPRCLWPLPILDEGLTFPARIVASNLARQRRSESVNRVPVRRGALPTLPPVRLFAVPAGPHNLASVVVRVRTLHAHSSA